MSIKDLLAPRYHIADDKPTGIGGQKFFYLAKDTYLDRQVAVKVPKDAATLNALHKEVAKVSLVSSKHVVKCLDQIKENGKAIAIVEEYITGFLLKDLDHSGMNLEAILRLLYQIAQGLVDIHSAGLVHRDITPSNLKIDDEGVLKILDFGIASFSFDDRTEIGRGTFAYKAPEVFARPMQPKPEVDIYSFGVIAHLLFSQGNLCGEFARGALRQKIAPPPPFNSFSVLDDDHALCDLLEACIAHDPQQRPTSIALRDALRARLTQGKHSALLTSQSLENAIVINQSKSAAKITFPGQNPLTIQYNGLEYNITSWPNECYINGRLVNAEISLQRSCIISIGSPAKGSSRHFITFDISQPEIVF